MILGTEQKIILKHKKIKNSKRLKVEILSVFLYKYKMKGK